MWPFVPRDRYDDLHDRYQRAVQARHELADQLAATQDALRTAARQYRDADTTANRLQQLAEHCRVLEEECLAAQHARELYMTQHQEEVRRLERELAEARAERDGNAPVTKRRLDRVLRACARYRIQLAAHDRMIRSQQRQLDSALGMDAPEIAAGTNWQQRRADKQEWIA